MSGQRDEDSLMQRNVVEDLITLQKGKEDLTKKLTEGEGKLGAGEKAAEEKINELRQKLQLHGSEIEIAQQNALIAFGSQYLLISVLCMLFLQLGILGAILTWIPLVNTLAFLSFILCIVLVQFAPQSIENKPFNFGIFVLHTVSKTLILLNLALKIEGVRFELYYLLFALVVTFILNEIKNSILAGEDFKNSFNSNAFKSIIVAFGLGAFLSLLTRESIWFILMCGLVGGVYALALMLTLRRFSEHTYLTKNGNDFYLGAVQLDADCIINCKLIAFLCFNTAKEEYEKRQSHKEEQKEQA